VVLCCAFLLGFLFDTENGGSTLLRNVGYSVTSQEMSFRIAPIVVLSDLEVRVGMLWNRAK
jgi:phosphate/sulfate permease